MSDGVKKLLELMGQGLSPKEAAQAVVEFLEGRVKPESQYHYLAYRIPPINPEMVRTTIAGVGVPRQALLNMDVYLGYFD